MISRTEYIDRLRKLADLLESTPDLILPYAVEKGGISFYPRGAAETAMTAKLLPSGWAKNDPTASDHDAAYYRLTGEWEGGSLTILGPRASICERIQVATKRVTIPAVKATPRTTVTLPVYEFKCEPLLAKAVA